MENFFHPRRQDKQARKFFPGRWSKCTFSISFSLAPLTLINLPKLPFASSVFVLKIYRRENCSCRHCTIINFMITTRMCLQSQLSARLQEIFVLKINLFLDFITNSRSTRKQLRSFSQWNCSGKQTNVAVKAHHMELTETECAKWWQFCWWWAANWLIYGP